LSSTKKAEEQIRAGNRVKRKKKVINEYKKKEHARHPTKGSEKLPASTAVNPKWSYEQKKQKAVSSTTGLVFWKSEPGLGS